MNRMKKIIVIFILSIFAVACTKMESERMASDIHFAGRKCVVSGDTFSENVMLERLIYTETEQRAMQTGSIKDVKVSVRFYKEGNITSTISSAANVSFKKNTYAVAIQVNDVEIADAFVEIETPYLDGEMVGIPFGARVDDLFISDIQDDLTSVYYSCILNLEINLQIAKLPVFTFEVSRPIEVKKDEIAFDASIEDWGEENSGTEV